MALLGAAIVYSQQHPHSYWMMSAALPAFLVEAIFYLGSGFASTRAWLKGIGPPWVQATLLWVSALLPYLIFSFSAGTFQPNAALLLAALSLVVAFWYVLLPRRLMFDLGFLVVAAAPLLSHVFLRIYLSPDPHTRADILGHLMWIRLGITVLLVLREWNPGSFGFWPEKKDWRAGVTWYLFSVVPLVAFALAIHDVQFAFKAGPWWRVAALGVGTFFGMLWVVALGEELFFRGIVERALLKAWRSPALAVLISALLFGSVHLSFGYFPDWRHSSVAALLGVALGIVYLQTNSVRASMVTHALVVATWRVFFDLSRP